MQITGKLQRNVLGHLEGPVTETAIKGLLLYHSDQETPKPAQLIYTPMVCVMAQGEKTVLLGDRAFRFSDANYFITSVDLPVSGIVCNAASGRPYLALSLAIDTAVLSDLLINLPKNSDGGQPSCGIATGIISDRLLDCFVRLTGLLDEPDDISHLAPLIIREILYRLLQDDETNMLRQIATKGSRSAQIANVIRWIRENYAEPFSMRTLSSIANMSPASLHRHFRVVTSMSPLQYQKQIRLREARRFLIAEGHDAAAAAFRVGYASPSQFSREYARTFGKPPRQDTMGLLMRS